MDEVVRFVPRSELERARLIKEANAKYESIFPDAEAPPQPKNLDRLAQSLSRPWLVPVTES
jgi:hypothetical protein